MVTKNTTDHNGHISGEITEALCSLCLHCVRCDLSWHYIETISQCENTNEKVFPQNQKVW